jgi:hypothetical protein
MAYHSSSNNNNDSTLSAVSFTSSTASATGASFASSDDPVSSGHSSLLVSWRKIFESVYRCDSAAVIDGTSTCGSVANQALYQGVEVVLKTTSTCHNNSSCGSAGNLKDSVKDSMASKPFFEYQCFCDDDDFVVNNNNEDEDEQPQHCTTPAHFRSSSCWSTGSGEDRNERNKDGVSSNNDVRNKPAENEEEECCDEAVMVRRSKWEAHTKKFYSKINAPAPRVVTTLSSLATSTSNSRRQRPELSPKRDSSSLVLTPTEETTTTIHKKKNNAASNGMQSSSSSSLRCWIPNRTLVSESREEQE